MSSAYCVSKYYTNNWKAIHILVYIDWSPHFRVWHIHLVHQMTTRERERERELTFKLCPRVVCMVFITHTHWHLASFSLYIYITLL